MQKTIRRSQLYWACQLGGWGAYTLTLLVVNMASTRGLSLQRARDLLPFVVLPVLGVLSTHCFRWLIRRQGWLRRSLPFQISCILVSSLILSLLINLGLVIIAYLLYGYEPEEYTALKLFSNFFNLAALCLIWSLIYFALHYFAHYKQAEIARLKKEADLRAMELHTLRSQINPHFIFNALNSIRALVAERPPLAQESLTRLSKLLRNSLYSNQQERIPLSEELAAVADYLALEGIRYEEKLSWHCTLADELHAWPVPVLSILTLVENAIKHGVARQLAGGYVRIQATLEADTDRLCVEVRNSGPLHPAGPGAGLGLQNIRDRLRILYDSHASFSLTQATNPETGQAEVLARLLLPRQRVLSLLEGAARPGADPADNLPMI
ncbi:MAG: histidine kinase [Bacteroidetes bacterium]|jgi:hypothetical protein|nr:histidine kinase [Bacteroidota bacterium]